ncbi:amino acid adenylation domain-containing protein [uncultured Jatrophihabitans sp.]|uniref:amino acid adenylation domain-containing protein n=1 Tax=uncultured Jatrophihabitans sp. TaxID=1610747 RepID=UPI0035CA6D83
MSEPNPSTQIAAYALGRQQRRHWRAGIEQEVYVHVVAPAGLSEATARKRLDDLVERHEVLRSRVVVPAGLTEPIQEVTQTPAVQLRLVDLGGPAPRLELRANALVADAPTLQYLAGLLMTGDPGVEDPIQYAEYAQWQDDLAAEPAEGAAAFWASLHEPSWTNIMQATPVNPYAGVAPPSSPVELHSPPRAHALALLASAASRLTGEDEIWLGVELDARRGGELDGAAGPYSEVLPARVPVAATDTLAAVELACERILADLETFQEWAPDAIPATAPIVLGLAPSSASAPRPDVQVELRVPAGGGEVTMVGGAVAVPRVSAALHALASADGATPVGAVDLFRSDALQPAVLQAPAVADGPSVLDRIAQHASNDPARVALRAGDRELGYGRLVACATALAGELGSTGAPIAVLAERSIGAVAAILGALASGRGYVPVDPAQPEARLRVALEDSGCDVILADADADLGGLAAVVDAGCRLIRVDPEAAPSSAGAALPEAPPDALAYVIYTSGSTGAPKGVEVTVANLDAYVSGVSSALRFGAHWNWALASSPATDLGNTAIFGSLAAGGALVLLSADEVLDPTAFDAAITTHRVDAIKMTPSHLANLLADSEPALPSSLIVLGGEALPWGLVDRIRAQSDVRIVNHYGPTETTVGAVAHEVSSDEPHRGSSVPIGRPLPGVAVAVRTPTGGVAPTGAIGELCISGTGVTRGYRHDAERTAAAFVDFPVSGRSYRTGDLVRIADGEVEFLGRRDGQVKIRGFRVETGEIEAALLAHPGVQRVAVVLSSDDGPPQLVAYVVSHYHPGPDDADLREQLRTRVPDYMIPAAFVALDAIPLTANGKLDRASLPTAAPTTTTYREPENVVESGIADIYAELLDVERVGRDDDFFRLGGHSLLATQAVMRIRQAFVVELPVHSLFLAPTVAGLSAQVEAMLLDSDDEA